MAKKSGKTASKSANGDSAKGVKNGKPSKPEKAKKGMSTRGIAIDVWGKVRAITPGLIKVKTVDGKQKTVYAKRSIVNKIIRLHAMPQLRKVKIDDKVFASTKAIAALEERGKLGPFITKHVIKEARVLRFICREGLGKNDEYDHAIGVVTGRWEPVTIEQLVPAIKEATKDVAANYDIVKSDGIFGGRCTITLTPETKDLPFDSQLVVSSQRLVGKQSIVIAGGVKILYCSNQLTIQVRAAVQQVFESLKVSGFRGRTVHGDNWQEPLQEAVTEAYAATEAILDLMNAAKKVRVKKKIAEALLNYYVNAVKLPKKWKEASLEAFGDENKAQVPHTLYGLIMAVSYVGTHDAEAKSPKHKLQTVAGEMLLGGKVWPKYTEAVLTVK